MSTSFLLIRHAESVWNAEGRWQGQADPPLSERGRAQAEALAEKLAGQQADCLLTSDLRRARETAEIVARAFGLAVESDVRLRELDVGKWSGLSRPEIEQRDPRDLERFEAGDSQVRAGGAESRAAIRQRVRAAFRDLARRHDGQRVVVVTHLGVVRALLPGMELPNAGSVELDAAALIAPDADPKPLAATADDSR